MYVKKENEYIAKYLNGIYTQMKIISLRVK